MDADVQALAGPLEVAPGAAGHEALLRQLPRAGDQRHVGDPQVHVDAGLDSHPAEGGRWYYPEPSEAAKEIAGHVSFWKGVEVR